MGIVPKFTEEEIANTASWTWDLQGTCMPSPTVRLIDNGNRKERRRKAALARRKHGQR